MLISWSESSLREQCNYARKSFREPRNILRVSAYWLKLYSYGAGSKKEGLLSLLKWCLDIFGFSSWSWSINKSYGNLALHFALHLHNILAWLHTMDMAFIQREFKSLTQHFAQATLWKKK